MTRDELIAALKHVGKDEPMFLLRAQDTIASESMKRYASLLRSAGAKKETVKAADDCVQAMLAWQDANKMSTPS
jgi:hypothetical protein